jgi:hypothetical protein
VTIAEQRFRFLAIVAAVHTPTPTTIPSLENLRIKNITPANPHPCSHELFTRFDTGHFCNRTSSASSEQRHPSVFRRLASSRYVQLPWLEAPTLLPFEKERENLSNSCHAPCVYNRPRIANSFLNFASQPPQPPMRGERAEMEPGSWALFRERGNCEKSPRETAGCLVNYIFSRERGAVLCRSQRLATLPRMLHSRPSQKRNVDMPEALFSDGRSRVHG